MITSKVWQEHKALSARCSALVMQGNISVNPEYIPAIEALNAFYAAHPEVLAFFKAQVKAARNKRFRTHKE